MRRPPLQSRLAHPRPERSRPAAPGFSFVELLFAVAVMGIGFIMIAAVFPIGLQQTKLTLDETGAASAARGAAARLQSLGSAVVRFGTAAGDVTSIMPATPSPGSTPVAGNRYRGVVRTFNDTRLFATGSNTQPRRESIWNTVSSEAINPSDPRNAAAVLYRHDAVGVFDPAISADTFAGGGTAQLIVINAQVGNASQYTQRNGLQPIFDLEPRPVAVQVVYDPDRQNYVATFFSVADLDASAGGGGRRAVVARGGYPAATIADSVLDAALGCVGEGAFVVISDDRIDAPAAAGRLNGRILRLGARRTDLTGLTFDLAPGYDFTPDPGPDGFLNAPGTPSTDDLVAIGADSGNNSSLRSGITYAAAASVDRPRGPNTPTGTGVTVGGSAGGRGAVALVLGRGFADPNVTPTVNTDYTGPVQDVSAYTTFVTVTP